VTGLHGLPDEPVGGSIVIEECVCEKQERKNEAKHLVILMREMNALTPQKNPRGSSRGGRWDGGGNLHSYRHLNPVNSYLKEKIFTKKWEFWEAGRDGEPGGAGSPRKNTYGALNLKVLSGSCSRWTS